MKTEEEEYKLIPMSEITDEARKLAVAWMECEDKHWIGQKHKLASDIMNYAINYHSQFTPDKVTDDKSCSNCGHHYQNGNKCDARPCYQGSNWIGKIPSSGSKDEDIPIAKGYPSEAEYRKNGRKT